MLGFSRTEHVVFTLCGAPERRVCPKIDIRSEILAIEEMGGRRWRALRALQGTRTVLYLRGRYGRHGTRLLLSYSGKKLVYIQWVVPHRLLARRYPFVSPESYAIIAYLTACEMRGKRIYPFSLEEFMARQNDQDVFWIWAATENVASLRGINAVGGQRRGRFIQTRHYWGMVSDVTYVPKEET